MSQTFHAFLFLHHDGVEKRGAREPGHEAGVLDRIPAPVAAPTEYGVGPMHAEEDAGSEEQPGHKGPDARDLDPFLAGVAHHECSEREAKGNREAYIAQVKHGGMNHHLRVLEQWIQAVAVVWNGAPIQREGRRCKVQYQQEEDLNPGQNGASIRVELHICFVGEAKDEAVGSQQPCPQEQ
jgi:hypothetical protein